MISYLNHIREKIGAHQCRGELEHVDPSCKYFRNELEEFISASELLAVHHHQHMLDTVNGKTKRQYRRWNPTEKYTLTVAISILGPRETFKIADIMEDRSENQVMFFKTLNFDFDVTVDRINRF